MTAAELRERIEAALRTRHATDDVNIETTRRPFGAPAWGVGADCGDVRHLVAGESATEFDALAALAVAVGLDADGTDPRAEVARLTHERDAALADAAQLRGVMRREIANTDHHANCRMYGTADDADPRCTCVVGALYRALEGGTR